MKLPRDLSGRELVKALSRLGYGVVRQTGSHIRLETARDGVHPITVPDHAAIKPGTLANILRDLEAHHHLTRDGLMKLLFE